MTSLAKYRVFFGRQVIWLFSLSVIVGIFLFLVESSFVFVFQGFLRAVKLVEPDKLLLPDWYPDSLKAAVILLIVFGVFRSVGYLFKVYLGGIVAQAFIRVQRERLLRFALENAEKLNTHEVINIYMERVAQASLLVNLGAQLILAFTTAFLFLILGLRMAFLEMAIAIVMLAIFLLPMRALNEYIKRAGEGVTSESELANRSLLQGLRHYFFLRIYGLIPQAIERGQTNIKNFEEHYRRFYLAHAFKHTFPVAAGIFVIGVITFISVQYLQTPSVKLISFFYIFMRLSQTASESSATFSEFRLQMPGFLRLFSWHERILASSSFHQAPRPRNSASRAAFEKALQSQGLSLDIRNICFSFEDSSPVIENLSVKIGRGDVLVIRGESGAGKSTLLSLALGLLQPSKGKVLINDLPIEDVRDFLGPHVAYVGPDPFLISGTVRENLLYGHPDIMNVSDTEIWDALEKAQLSKEIQSLAGKLEEVLHEHTQLSTGQKQRLAIARAVLRHPKLLILDEASANLDGATERNFIEGLRNLLPNLTTFVISHKNSFDQIATNTLELKKINSKHDYRIETTNG
jgi:ABC-type multidrug transport system fused ATPase/permease subunit